MMKRWTRRALRRCGIALPFSDVVCPEHVKSICIGPDARARVTVRQKLVFLDLPERGELCDVCPVDPQTTFENFVLHSQDAVETGRRRLGRTAFAINWEPRSRLAPYALYEHEYSWFPAGSYAQPALCTDVQCDIRTGSFLLEIITPETFEAAVVFERPRWPLLTTERRVVKYALSQLESGVEQPSILENGQRVEWKVMGPRVGARYICVAFHQNGVLLWKEQLRKSSLSGQMRQLAARLVPR